MDEHAAQMAVYNHEATPEEIEERLLILFDIVDMYIAPLPPHRNNFYENYTYTGIAGIARFFNNNVFNHKAIDDSGLYFTLLHLTHWLFPIEAGRMKERIIRRNLVLGLDLVFKRKLLSAYLPQPVAEEIAANLIMCED